MKSKYKKWALLWLGVGFVLRSLLYIIQTNYNSKYSFIRKDEYQRIKRDGYAKDYFKSNEDKLYTYYDVIRSLTIGGMFIILGFGIKENT